MAPTTSAALTCWWATVVWAAPAADDAGRPILFFFLGVSKDLVTGSIHVMSLLSGATGLHLLVLALPCPGAAYPLRSVVALGFRDYVHGRGVGRRTRVLSRSVQWLATADQDLLPDYSALAKVFMCPSSFNEWDPLGHDGLNLPFPEEVKKHCSILAEPGGTPVPKLRDMERQDPLAVGRRLPAKTIAP